MPDYITRTDVKDRLARQYATLYTKAGTLDETLIDDDIEAAEAEVNGYLGARYAVPVTAGLALVKGWCLTLVEELAYSRSPAEKLPEKITARVAAVRKALADAARGTLTLGADPAPSEKSAGADAIVVSGPDPEFTREKMSGF
jgi:phage gp36-like protein